MLVQEPVQAAIWHCLNHYDYNDAIFLAERLRAEVESDETIWLLATCYYRSGKPAQAYSILKSATSPQCKFLLAKCCIDLNKPSEAEKVVGGGDLGRPRAIDEVVKEYGDMASFALILLAKVAFQTERHDKAVEATTKALKMNPFLWSAFETLCKSGEKPNPAHLFNINNLDNLNNITGTNPVINYVNSNCATSTAFTSLHNNNTTTTPAPPITSPTTPSGGLPALLRRGTPDYLLDENLMSGNKTPNMPLISGGMYGCMSGIRAFTPEVSPLPLPASCRPKRAIRYRNIFSGTNSPFTPSFGVIPLDLNASFDLTSHLSPLNTLTEANDQKLTNKRMGFPIHFPKQTRMRHCQTEIEDVSRNNSPGLRERESGGEGRANVTPGSGLALPLPSTPRRSTRLFSNSYSVKENSKSPNRGKFVTPKSPSRKTKAARGLGKGRNNNSETMNEKNMRSSSVNSSNNGSQENLQIDSKPQQQQQQLLQQQQQQMINSFNSQALEIQRQSLDGLMLLLKEIGMAYLYLTEFECKRSIKHLSALPPHQKNTGWVLCHIAKAYFEMSDYNHAAKFFAEAHSREPERTQLMEIYSTCLWHLAKENQLSALAQDMISLDKNCPQTWCIAGNCLSLNKEHDQAIKLFQRAVQVDPTFVYAYTLLGHEYAVTEDLDRGMASFRNAVRLDIRHYNAWYGMGTIYSKQEKFQLAELHYKRALAINPSSCVLMCHIGVMQLALQKKEEALETLDRALRLEPNNALCKFQRARVLTSCGAHQEALTELEQLKQLVPKESMVYYLTGKVHKKLGNTHLAIMHFSWATDLDPKGNAPQIKEAIDSSLPHQADHLGEEMSNEELLMTPNQANDTASSGTSDLAF